MHVSLGWQPINCIALKLHDDLSNPHPQSFAKGKAFREIFPNIKQLPFLMVLSPEGKPLASLQGADVAKNASQVFQKTALQFPFKVSNILTHAPQKHSSGFSGPKRDGTLRTCHPYGMLDGFVVLKDEF